MKDKCILMPLKKSTPYYNLGKNIGTKISKKEGTMYAFYLNNYLVSARRQDIFTTMSDMCKCTKLKAPKNMENLIFKGSAKDLYDCISAFLDGLYLGIH